MTTKIIWNTKDPATPALIPLLIEDMGIGDNLVMPVGEAVKATAEYMERIIKEWDSPTIGQVMAAGHAFFDGYLAGMLNS
jgi:hypothetical protein